MAQYLSPGVYVEEIPPAAKPIAGVGTSTAGFIGVVADDVAMPLQPGSDTAHYTVAAAGEPQLITNWVSFQNTFGDFQAGNSTLAHAVYGFFNNGGTRCWVMRVSDAGDLTDPANELTAFAPIDEIAIVAIPGAATEAQHSAIISHCFNMGDRFAVLDGVQDPADLTAGSIAPVGRSEAGSYAAVYFPWIQVSDPITSANISAPPSGHMAGIYARSDANRGVHKAPANEVILGALDVDQKLSKSDQDGLNPEGVNVVRVFNGTIKVWGARTRADEAHSEHRYISTRRFFNYVRESIEEGTQWVVFEPNAHPLWERIKRSATDFLTRSWRDGALFGETAAQAFFVKCDEETNPADVREAGQVVTEIGIAIVKPAEFVIFRIQQQTGG